MSYCPVCGGEFVDRVTQCPDCGIALVGSIFSGSGAGSGGAGPEIWPIVFESGDPADLAVARSVLEGAGIDHVTEGEAQQDFEGAGRLGTGFSVPFGPAKLRVPPDRAPEAQLLLGDMVQEEDLDSFEVVPPARSSEGERSFEEEKGRSESPRRPARGRGRLLAGLAAGVLLGWYGPQVVDRGSPAEDGVVAEDTNGDGEPDIWVTYRDGLVVLVAADLNGDGRKDSWSSYDGEGQISSGKYDDNYDGKQDYWVKYRGGRPASAEADSDGDGEVDFWRLFRSNGLTSSEDSDFNYDGRPDAWYRYGSDGRVVSEEQDFNFDGKPDAWYRHERSQRVEGREDTDFDGEVDVVTRYQHTLPVEAIWEPRPGAPARRVLYRDGQRREEQRDLDGDGRYDQRILLGPFEQPIEVIEIR